MTDDPLIEEPMDYSPIGSLHEDKAEIRRLRAENERLCKAFRQIDRACAEFQARGKIVPALIYDAVRDSRHAFDETQETKES